MENSKSVAVLGGGSFGTVLANLAASNGYNVSLWVRDSEQALRINSEGANTTYHPELKLSKNIIASDNLKEVLYNKSIIFITTASIFFEQILIRVPDYIDAKPYFVSCINGNHDDPFRQLSDIIS